MRDLRWLPFHVPASTGLPFTLRGLPAAQWTLNVDWSVLLIGGGALLGFRTGWSMLFGGLLNFCVLARWMHDRGVFGTVSFRSLVPATCRSIRVLVVCGRKPLARAGVILGCTVSAFLVSRPYLTE